MITTDRTDSPTATSKPSAEHFELVDAIRDAQALCSDQVKFHDHMAGMYLRDEATEMTTVLASYSLQRARTEAAQALVWERRSETVHAVLRAVTA